MEITGNGVLLPVARSNEPDTSTLRVRKISSASDQASRPLGLTQVGPPDVEASRRTVLRRWSRCSTDEREEADAQHEVEGEAPVVVVDPVERAAEGADQRHVHDEPAALEHPRGAGR